MTSYGTADSGRLEEEGQPILRTDTNLHQNPVAISNDRRGLTFGELICHYVDSEQFICCVPAEYIFVPKDKHRVVINNERVASVFLVLNAMIGSGVLSQGWVVGQSGLVLAAVAYPVVASISYFGVVVMIEAANRSGVYHFGNLADRVLGGFGFFLTEWSIIVTVLMCLVAYLILIGDMIVGVAKDYYSGSLPIYLSKNFLVVIIVVVIVVPICLVRRLGHLKYIAYVSQGIVAAIAVALIATANTEVADHDNEPLVLGSFVGFLKSVGIIVFAIVFGSALFHVHRAMRLMPTSDVHEIDGFEGTAANDSTATAQSENCGTSPPTAVTVDALGKSNLELAEVSLYATVVGTIVLALIGLLGYAAYRDHVSVNIVDNFPGDLGVCFRILVTLHLLLFIPAEFVIMRASFSNYYSVDVESQEDMSYILYTIISIVFVTVVTLLLNQYAPSSALAVLLNLCGGVACSIYTFVVPGMLGKVIFRENSDFKSNQYSITRFLQKKIGYGDEDVFFFWGSVSLEVFGWISIIAVIIGQFI